MADNTFFYPNCCHFCKIWNVKLISCAKCQMISYCSERHQQEHLPEHQEICTAIKRVLGDKEYMNTEEISMEEWSKIRFEYVKKVSHILQRELKYEESEMFLFPKACAVCHRQDTVIRCNNCPSAAFCDKHRDRVEHGEKNCELSREALNLSNCLALTEDIDISYVDHLSNETLFYDMKGFLDIYVPLDENDIFLQVLHSDKLTNPLTVYFCIQQLDYLTYETLSIHVIGTQVIKHRMEFQIWTMLLTLIPTLTKLTITFIQTERTFTECGISEEVLNVSETKKLEVYIRYMSYEKYVGTTDFKKPNFIVGFDAVYIDSNKGNGMNQYVDFSERSGTALAEQMCPCILIFEYMHRVDVETLKKIEKYFLVNPFANILLYRHFETERVYYPNNYLIIFNDVDSSKVFINGGNQCILYSKTTKE